MSLNEIGSAKNSIKILNEKTVTKLYQIKQGWLFRKKFNYAELQLKIDQKRLKIDGTLKDFCYLSDCQAFHGCTTI